MAGTIKTDPFVINWKGKIGYGDIISPISYVLNLADKNSTNAILRFHWPYNSPQKYKPEDTETLQDRIDITWNYINSSKVTIEHIYNSKLDYNHNDYDETNFECHNLRISDTPYLNAEGGRFLNSNIVMVTSMEHKETWDEYGRHKAWKDPLAGTWPKACEQIKNRNWDLDFVHYSDKMENVIQLMKNCRGVIGYHGAHMWIARMLGLPMIIFSKKSLTDKAFPWCIRFENWTTFSPDSIEEYFQQSIQKREEVKKKYEQYLTEPNIHRLRGKRT